ncbi:RNA polymerase sigma factor [Roseivirga thermotolerans]|uniref:ECF subfamily RNA polymerase sigma factor n=1 Tax=Roseivirga thermotolerans TaxID=1758176 RepID=A0ABQ3I3K2_9BACT|nr:RNA polymerase sigma factor [Roseivirga thermotolerans]GHE52971.1 ECF subfamily RNA polymerase sigma factor [Roseivirga thermotolerans]
MTKTKYSELTEIELIEKSKEDKTYFKPLYEKYYEQIFRLVFARVQDVELTGEITSEAFSKTLANIHKFEYKGYPFSAWITRIAINCCYDYFRAKQKNRMVSLENYTTHDIAFEIELEENDKELWLTLLPDILEKLKPKDLELVEMRFFEGKSFAEIAFILDITEGNAKTRTYRVLKRMKKLFRQGTR